MRQLGGFRPVRRGVWMNEAVVVADLGIRMTV